MAAFFNTGLTQQAFLDQYWQKKPLLIRQAFVDFKSPISADELAGLACEPDCESRLIEEKGPDGPWQLTNGPLAKEDFARLPKTHWTMLVQDVDKHLPEMAELLEPFNFIPSWRRDDLMVSYAPKHGSVGPHTDGYDVFLLQAEGERHWQIGGQPTINPDLIQNLDLQILAEFEPDYDWTLQPGDMLYLPPHFAHHGIALNDCMTFSVGFRAPSRVELLDCIVNNLLENDMGKARYADPDLTVPENSSEIRQESLARIKLLLHDAIEEAEPILAEVFGKLVTETKPSLEELASDISDDMPSIEQLEQRFDDDAELRRNPYYRFAWIQQVDQCCLFMGGQAYPVAGDSINIAMLAESLIITADDWEFVKQDLPSAKLLCQLIAEGGWFWAE